MIPNKTTPTDYEILDLIKTCENKGKRFLQGCYIDHDSSEGKL